MLTSVIMGDFFASVQLNTDDARLQCKKAPVSAERTAI